MTAPLMTRHRNTERRPWGLILLLVFAAAVGLVSLPLQISALQQVSRAASADVTRAENLARDLSERQAADSAEAKAFREDSRRLQLAICDQIEAISRQAMLEVPPCPRVGG